MKLFNNLPPKGYFSAISTAATEVFSTEALQARIKGVIKLEVTDLGNHARKKLRSEIHEKALAYLNMMRISDASQKAFSFLTYLKETASRYALKRTIVQLYPKNRIMDRINLLLKPVLHQENQALKNQLLQPFNQRNNFSFVSWEEAFSTLLHNLFTKDSSLAKGAEITKNELNSHINSVVSTQTKLEKTQQELRLTKDRGEKLHVENQKIEDLILLTEKEIDALQDKLQQNQKAEQGIVEQLSSMKSKPLVTRTSKEDAALAQKLTATLREIKQDSLHLQKELEEKQQMKNSLTTKREQLTLELASISKSQEEKQASLKKPSEDLLSGAHLQRFAVSLDAASQKVVNKHPHLEKYLDSLLFHHSLAHVLGDISGFLEINAGGILPGAFSEDSEKDRLRLNLAPETLDRSVSLQEVSLIPTRRSTQPRKKEVRITQNVIAPMQTLEGKKVGNAEIKMTYFVDTSKKTPKVTSFTTHNPKLSFDFS